MYCLTVLLTSADQQQAQRWFQQTMTAGYGEVAALAMPRSFRRELPPVPTWTCPHCGFVQGASGYPAAGLGSLAVQGVWVGVSGQGGFRAKAGGRRLGHVSKRESLPVLK